VEYTIEIGSFLNFISGVVVLSNCLQCFDAVGWAAGKASSL